MNEDAFQAEIDQIDLEISQMVAEEPTVWEFADLHTRAETAVSRAQTALERGGARLVLAKIERFQEIKHASRMSRRSKRSRPHRKQS